jgi:hypothetical protein
VLLRAASKAREGRIRPYSIARDGGSAKRLSGTIVADC